MKNRLHEILELLNRLNELGPAGKDEWKEYYTLRHRLAPDALSLVRLMAQADLLFVVLDGQSLMIDEAEEEPGRGVKLIPAAIEAGEKNPLVMIRAPGRAEEIK